MNFLLSKLLMYLQKKKGEELLNLCGGIQTCPWCRQLAQSGEGWGFSPCHKDPFLDVLTCGVCKGTSLWKFEHGMDFIGVLDPPTPAFPNAPYYDVDNFKLKSGEIA